MPVGNNSIFGAFTLGELRSGRLSGEWLHPDVIANYGWFGGGTIPAVVSTVDRIDFSNDLSTASVRGSLSAPTYSKAATGNSNFGWFGGGGSSSFTSVATIDRIDFSNDSSTTSVRSPLSQARHRFAATGNSNYGWFGGGFFPAPFPSVYATVDRIDFSNDSLTASRGSLSAVRYRLAATGNSNFGWFGGGNNPSPTPAVSTIDRIDFANDLAIAAPRGPLSLANTILAATGNSNYGWFGGGNGPVSTVDRIDFSNDSLTTSVRGPLSAARSYLSATANSNYGWFTANFASLVDRIDFSNDSATASVRGPLSLARSQLTGATSGVLNIRRQKVGNFGWFGGGGDASLFSSVDRIDFSNDMATASVRGSLSLARMNLAATGNSNYGWFGGGANPAVPATFSAVDRIDFANDLATATPRGPLILTKYTSAATGNTNYGWFGGGVSTVLTTRVDRIDFSNDSTTASPRGPLSLGRESLAATGNSNYGWFGAGASPSGVTTRVDRIDFSNDSSTASVRGSLVPGRFYISATGNSNYGWFDGGQGLTTVNRIDFSNDSSTASVRGPLSSARYGKGATGNSNYGWFGGGQNFTSPTSVVRSIVDRIDFSNDSVQAPSRNPLNINRSGPAATSNTPTG